MIDLQISIAIIGHIHPDGDCIGSNLAMYNYITENYKGKTVDVYDESFHQAFKILSGYRKIKHEPGIRDMIWLYPLMYLIWTDLEVSRIYNTAISTVCIDHHVSNKGFGDFCYIVPDSSSACEAMCDLLIWIRSVKKLLIVFILEWYMIPEYSSTALQETTMELAGLLIEKGAKPDIIIDETFYKKTYKQNQLMARVILDSVLYEGGRIIFGILLRRFLKNTNVLLWIQME